jgi:hypothetical protein
MLIPKRSVRQNQTARFRYDMKRGEHIEREIKRLRKEFSGLRNARLSSKEFYRLALKSQKVERAYERSVGLRLLPEIDAEAYLTNLRFQRECWERLEWQQMLTMLKN